MGVMGNNIFLTKCYKMHHTYNTYLGLFYFYFFFKPKLNIIYNYKWAKSKHKPSRAGEGETSIYPKNTIRNMSNIIEKSFNRESWHYLAPVIPYHCPKTRSNRIRECNSIKVRRDCGYWIAIWFLVERLVRMHVVCLVFMGR